MKKLIKGGYIVDGLNREGFLGDVLIDGDQIVKVAPEITCEDAEVIEVKGLTVAPGFIDTHSHSDVFVLTDRAIPPKLFQGITTELLGQDGISVTPLPEGLESVWRKNIGGLNGDTDNASWDYRTCERYFDAIEAQKHVANYAYLSPHGNIRSEVMGFEDRVATAAEVKQMQAVLRRELELGACGMSSGLIYIPCVYGDTNEMVKLCQVLAEYKKPFVVHQRNEGGELLESMEELYTIVKESGVHLHISHLKASGVKNEYKKTALFEKMAEIEAMGYGISADQYPYFAGSTMFGSVLPPFAHAGGTEMLLERLKNKEERAKIKEHVLHVEKGWSNTLQTCRPENVFITSVKNKEAEQYIGKSIVEIGEMMGKDYVEAAMDLILSEDNIVGMVEFYGTEETIMDIMKHKDVNICTDGLLGGTPHPRVYGSFPRVLGRYCREKQLFSLPEAIHKMTKKGADVIGLKDRGVIREGFKADLTIFNFDTIIDVGDYVNPRQLAKGVEIVIINGKTALKDGKIDENACSGEVLRLK